jgi:thiamine kinase-like enzyme
MSITLEQALARVPLFQSNPNLQPQPITGGITNRNYRVEVNGESFVLRLSGKNTELLGIHRPTEREANSAAAALGFAPEVMYFIEPEGYLVTRFVEGEPITVETMRMEDWLAQVAGALHQFHTRAPVLETTFDIFEVIAALAQVARENHCVFPPNFTELMGKAAAVKRAFAYEPYTPRPCHNDLLNANFLNSDGKLIILDWEYAGMGDVYFDLANFSHHHALADTQIRFFLAAYFGAATGKHFARLKLMEPLSDLREALWGTVQTGISTLDEDFAGYAHQWYARAAEAFQAERFQAWLSTVSGPDRV